MATKFKISWLGLRCNSTQLNLIVNSYFLTISTPEPKSKISWGISYTVRTTLPSFSSSKNITTKSFLRSLAMITSLTSDTTSEASPPDLTALWTTNWWLHPATISSCSTTFWLLQEQHQLHSRTLGTLLSPLMIARLCRWKTWRWCSCHSVKLMDGRRFLMISQSGHSGL